MIKDAVTILFTRQEIEELSTLVTVKTGELQYRAIEDPTLDEAWKFWNDISRLLAGSMGFQSYMNPETDYSRAVLEPTMRQIIPNKKILTPDNK